MRTHDNVINWKRNAERMHVNDRKRVRTQRRVERLNFHGEGRGGNVDETRAQTRSLNHRDKCGTRIGRQHNLAALRSTLSKLFQEHVLRGDEDRDVAPGTAVRMLHARGLDQRLRPGKAATMRGEESP